MLYTIGFTAGKRHNLEEVAVFNQDSGELTILKESAPVCLYDYV